MALVERYLQTANSSAYYQSVFGGSLSAGGGGGTSGNPWSAWSVANTEIISAGSLADDFVLHVHPAAVIADSMASSIWDDLGRAGKKYASIKVKRWQSIVDGDSRYANWKPTAEGNITYITAGQWTQGSVSAGVWSAGAGDVYKLTTPIASTTFADTPNGRFIIRCWGGHQLGDNVNDPTVRLVNCYTLADISAEGDWCHLTNTTALDLYVKTGAAGVDPSTRWGYFCYYRNKGNVNSVWIRNCKNITFEDFKWIGSCPYMSQQNIAGQANENITFTRPVHRMGNNGIYQLDTHLSSQVINMIVDSPDFDSCMSQTTLDKGAYWTENGSMEGITSYTSQLSGLLITDPKITGYSHAQMNLFPSVANKADATTRNLYPNGIEVRVQDTSNGKGVLTGGPGYQRGLAIQSPGYCRVGPLRFSKQKIQFQFDGVIDFVGLYFDSTCTNYADEYPDQGTGWGGGSHMCFQAVTSGTPSTGYTFRRIRFIGCRQENVAQHALYWGNDAPANCIEVLGCLITDGGQERRRQNSDGATYALYSRHRAPILGESLSTPVAGPFQIVKNNLFVLDPACVGMASAKIAGSTPSASANGTNYPLVQVTDTAWGGSIAGNQSGTLTGFGFDASLNYIGDRKTPVQTGPRSGRGYR